MRYALFAMLLLFTTVLGFRAGEAQQIRSPYRFIDETQTLGVYAGYLLADAGTPAVGPRNAPLFGARYNLRFTGPLSGEAALSFVPSEREVVTADTLGGEIQPVPTGQLQPMNLLLVEAGLRFHLTGARAWRGLAPFLVASGGIATDLSGRGEADEELPEQLRFRFGPSFAVGLGAGTDLFLGERSSLRLEARDHILRLPIPAGFRATGGEERQWINNFAFTLGVALHF